MSSVVPTLWLTCCSSWRLQCLQCLSILNFPYSVYSVAAWCNSCPLQCLLWLCLVVLYVFNNVSNVAFLLLSMSSSICICGVVGLLFSVSSAVATILYCCLLGLHILFDVYSAAGLMFSTSTSVSIVVFYVLYIMPTVFDVLHVLYSAQCMAGFVLHALYIQYLQVSDLSFSMPSTMSTVWLACCLLFSMSPRYL